MNNRETSNASLPNKGKKPLVVALTCAFAIGVTVLWMNKSHSDDSKNTLQNEVPMLISKDNKISIPEQSPLRQRIKIAQISPSEPNRSIAIPGVVEADPAHMVNILPPLTGRLLSLNVKLGDVVKAGQIVATMSSPDLAQAHADAEKARDAADVAKRALERGRGVNSAGANAAKDLEQLESAFNQAQAELVRTQSRLSSLGVSDAGSTKQHLLTITAPVSGTVTVLNNAPGAYINDVTATIMTIANLETVWITANVPENLVSALHKDQAAEVSLPAYEGQVLKGKIAFVSAILDADTHRNKARISFANADGKLKPNMFASVKLALTQTGQLVIPSSALLMNNDSITVFVETAPWTFVRRTVVVGREDGEQVSIESGLNAGERIVISGGVLLND